jgi:hypothetical protein
MQIVLCETCQTEPMWVERNNKYMLICPDCGHKTQYFDIKIPAIIQWREMMRTYKEIIKDASIRT